MQDKEIRAAITPARLSAFDKAAAGVGLGESEALRLYEWNAELSSSLLLPLHLFEVVLRNAIHDALTKTYQERWPWDNTFLYSVPVKHGLYKPRENVMQNATKYATTGKVIPELKFVFWEHMLTRRYDAAVWEPWLTAVFPNVPHATGVSPAVRGLAKDVETVRNLRNRVAHHEPIFDRNVHKVINAVERVASYRSKDVGQWVKQLHRVRTVLAKRPC